MMHFLTPIYFEPVSKPRLDEEIYRSILVGAGAAASMSNEPDIAAEQYINSSLKALSALSFVNVQLSPFNGTGTGKRNPIGEGGNTYNVIYKHSSGTGGRTINIINLPPDSEVVLVDGKLNLVSKTNSGTLSFGGESGSYYLIAYTKDSQLWSYSGTVTTNYKYTIQGSSIISSAWSSPLGFPYILIYGVPQLGLVRTTDGAGNLVAEAIKEPWSNVTTVPSPVTSFSGRIYVIAPSAWYFGVIEGGEVFVYG